jgi:hypothetical protein
MNLTNNNIRSQNYIKNPSKVQLKHKVKVENFKIEENLFLPQNKTLNDFS